MSKYVDNVKAFHAKFGLPTAMDNPHIPSAEIMDYRLGFLMEELDEVADGINKDDIGAVADGLIDLIYVAIGTGLFMGLPMDELWDEVQFANMNKVRAENASDSKRNSHFDVIKPVGWKGPDIAGVLARCHEEEPTKA